MQKEYLSTPLACLTSYYSPSFLPFTHLPPISPPPPPQQTQRGTKVHTYLTGGPGIGSSIEGWRCPEFFNPSMTWSLNDPTEVPIKFRLIIFRILSRALNPYSVLHTFSTLNHIAASLAHYYLPNDFLSQQTPQRLWFPSI